MLATGFGLLVAVWLALAPYVAVDIVDDPPVQSEWGYAPEVTHVAPGTWVVWSNAGVDTHTVTAADGSFDSHDLNPSEGFSFLFTTPGTYAYYCVLHPWMQGSVVVEG